jgi:hypothetical protein
MQPETIAIEHSPQFVLQTRVRLSPWVDGKKGPLREENLFPITRVNASKTHYSATGREPHSEFGRSLRLEFQG